MPKRIEYQELIDLDGYRRAVADARTDYQAFVTDVKSLNAEMARGMQSVVGELKALKSGASVETDNRSLAEYEQRAKALSAQLKDQKTATEALNQVQAQHEKVVGSLVSQQEKLLNQYAAITGNTAKDAQQRKRLATELAGLATQLDKVGRATKLSGETTKEVTGTYNRLQKELADARKELKGLDDAFDRTTGAINRNNQAALDLSKRINTADGALKKMDAGMGQYGRNVGNYGMALQGLFSGGVTGLLGNLGLAGVALATVAEAGGRALEKMSEFEQIRGGLKGVSKDSQDLAHSQEFLEATADRLGIRFAVLAEAYKGVKVGTRDTILEGKEADRIFAAFTNRLAEVKAPAEKSERALNALQQMISKGNVQAEELRGQMGDAMPGAFKLFADALGVSTEKLNDMLKNGEVLAVDVLPKVADQLEKTFSGTALENVDALGGATARLDNQTGLLLDTFNQTLGITSFFAKIKNGIADTLSGMRLAVQSGEWSAFVGFLSNPLTFFAGSSDEFKNRAEANKPLEEFKAMNAKMRDAKIKVLQDEAARIKNELKKTNNKQDSLESILGIDHVLTPQELSDRNKKLEQLKKTEEEITKFRRANIKLGLADANQAHVTEAAGDKKAHDNRLEALKKQTAEQTLAQRQARTAQLQQVIANNTDKAHFANDPLNTDKNNSVLQRAKEELKIIQDVNKELAKKDTAAGKRDAKEAARDAAADARKAKQEAEARLQNDLGTNRAGTGRNLENAEYSYRLGLTEETDYINQRLTIQQDGILREQELLRNAGKEKTDEYAKTETELNKIATDYLQARNKLSENAFKEAIATLRGIVEADTNGAKSLLVDRLRELETAYETESGAVELAVARREITEEEGERRLYALKLKYLEDTARAAAANSDTIVDLAKKRVADLETQLRAEGKSEADIAKALADERKRIEDEQLKAKQKAADDSVAITKAKTAEEVRLERKADQEKQEIISKSTELAIAAVSGFTDLANSFRDQDIANLERQKEHELSLVGENAEARANIEQKFAAKERELKRKQATADKVSALFAIAVNTAVAASKFTPFSPLFYLTLASGALQAALVAARPLPEFYKGTTDAPEGPAWVGERGYELVESKKGGKPTYRLMAEKQVAYLNKHDRVYTHEETKRILKVNTELASEVRSAPGGSQYVPQAVATGPTQSQLTAAFKDAIADLPIEQTIFDENGLRRYTQKRQHRTEWLNDYFSLPRK